MKQAIVTKNRRKNQRALISIAVKRKTGYRVTLCQANNISTEGIFIAYVSDDLPVPNKCSLEFSIPGSNILITTRAVVLREMEYERFVLCALKFAAIAPSHKRLIKAYINGPPLASAMPPFIPDKF